MTSLIYPNNIDTTYPVAGQDNDTQGFRTNFTNIKNNLQTAKDEITALQGNVTTLNNGTFTSGLSVTGNITASGGLTISSGITSLGGAIQFANLTTAQIATISPTNRGMTVYNYTTGNIQVYNGTKWANVTLS